MKSERSVEEIKAHRHEVLPDAEKYRAKHCNIDVDFITGMTTLLLTVVHSDTAVVRSLRFENVSIEQGIVDALRDATGFYLMTTGHLGWSGVQHIEVGDWDGGPPLFWAEKVEIVAL